MKVGFIGIGTMGGHMALNVRKGGHDVVVHDVREAAAGPHLKAGCTWANSAREVAEASDVVFTSLPGPKEVQLVAEELLARMDVLPRGYRPPYLEAHVHRFRARLEGDGAGYAVAAARFRELSMPFWVAVSQLEHAELLGGGAEAERLRAEAREVFEQLGAAPWLERAGVRVEAVAG